MKNDEQPSRGADSSERDPVDCAVEFAARMEASLTAVGRSLDDLYRFAEDPKGRERMADWIAANTAGPIVDASGRPLRETITILESRNIIEVPDLDATDLTALTEKHCDLTFLDGDYRRWDFWKGCLDGRPISGRGKWFEFMIWEPKRKVLPGEVREHFQTNGFFGNAGAFTAFVKERKPVGYHASIPEENGCWCDSDGNLYAPYSVFGSGPRALGRLWVGRPWGGDWSFVGFRELSV